MVIRISAFSSQHFVPRIIFKWSIATSVVCRTLGEMILYLHGLFHHELVRNTRQFNLVVVVVATYVVSLWRRRPWFKPRLRQNKEVESGQFLSDA